LQFSEKFAILVQVTEHKGDIMTVISYTEARNHFKSVLDNVVEDADYAVITRRDAEDAVVMSLDYFDSLMETVHLLKSPANAAHIAKSIEQYKQGKITIRDIVVE